jgi:glutamate-1-semialdehyde aminotransferase
MTSNVVGGMFGLFFTEVDTVINFEQTCACDVERAQVLIEAVIAEITSSDINELGIQWLGGNFGISML